MQVVEKASLAKTVTARCLPRCLKPLVKVLPGKALELLFFKP